MACSLGRSFLFMLILNCLIKGPLSNIEHNVNEVALSIGCNIDVQITLNKMMFVEPQVELMEEIVKYSVELQAMAQNVSKEFQAIRDEVMGQYGYDFLGQNREVAGNSTQEQYTAKTRMRCEHIVKECIKHCQNWFSAKWKNCTMDTIKYPVLSHFLCLHMKFEKTCNITKVMSPWCKEKVPVEGNFGMTYDRLNSAINKLGEPFTATIVNKQESVRNATHFHMDFKTELNQSLQETKDILEKMETIMKIFLSLSFIPLFQSVFSYVWKYTTDICFDNVYITTYFRLIDERRQQRNARHLLPITNAEKFGYIDPCTKKIHPNEPVVIHLLKAIYLVLFATVLLSIDAVLYSTFDITPEPNFTNFSHTGSQDVHIDISGESMLAKLLRKTIVVLNKSSNIDLQSINKDCLPKIKALDLTNYVYCLAPLLLWFALDILQVYINRLRRVIMAFYFPKREKRRILYLYNLHLLMNRTYVVEEGKRLRAQGYPRKRMWYMLNCIFNRCRSMRKDMCWVCETWVILSDITRCPSQSCNAVYCPQCWGDRQSCVVCPNATNTDVYDNSYIGVYYAC